MWLLLKKVCKRKLADHSSLTQNFCTVVITDFKGKKQNKGCYRLAMLTANSGDEYENN